MTAPLTVNSLGWVLDQLDAALPDVGVDSKTPAGLQTSVPFVKIERAGGGNDNYALDFPRLAFHCWGTSQGDADRLGYRVIGALRALRGVTANGATCTQSLNTTGPVFAVAADQNLAHAVVLSTLVIKAA